MSILPHDQPKYGYRKHQGGLKESLQTSKYITFEEFKKMLPNYKLYAQDSRCCQIVFIHKDFPNNNHNADWLFIEYGLSLC